MINKAKILFLLTLLVTAPAKADDRVGHFDSLELLKDGGTARVLLKGPDSLSANWTMTLPDDNGDAGEFLQTDGNGNTTWAPVILSSIDVDQTKTTTNSETLNDVSVTYAPTGAADNMVNLQVSSTVSTDQNVNAVTGILSNVSAPQDGDVAELNGVTSNLDFGIDGTATTLGSVYPFRSYTLLRDDAVVSGSATLLQLTLDAGSSSSINNLNGVSAGGTIEGSVAGGSGFSWSPNVASLTGYFSVFNFGGTITQTNNALTAISIGPTVTTMTGTNSWNTINDGVGFTILPGLTGYNFHPAGDDVTYDVSFLDAGASIDTVGRNVNTVNIHNNFDEVNANFNGFSEGTDFGSIVGGSPTSFSGNTKGSVPGDATVYGAFPQITQRAAANQIVEITTKADVGSSLGGQYFRTCSAYAETPSNECIKVWYNVDGVFSAPSSDGDTLVEVGISSNSSASSVATATAAAIDALTKFDASSVGDKLTVEVVANGRAGGVDTGGITGGWDWKYTQGGGGDGVLKGFTFGAGQSSGYDADHIVAFDAGGYPVSFGKINAFTNYTVVSSTPNPANVHTIGANFSVGDSATVTNGDAIGVGGIGQVTVGDGSTVTSGGLKVGATSAGKISLMQAGSGSSMENVTSDLAASILTAGSGTFTNVTGYRAVNANFGASTPMTNYRAFFADAPAGPGAATNTWALYADDVFNNYMGGSLKLGDGDDSPDKTLDVEGDAQIGDTGKVIIKADGRVKFKSYTTSERDALPSPEAGDTIFNTDTGSLETYDGSNWI